MTYNFDPERWYEIERAAVEARHAAGAIDDAARQRALDQLLERYEELLERIDIQHDYGADGDA